MPKIAFFETEEWEKPYFRAKLKGYDVAFFDHPIDEDNTAEAKEFDIISVFIYSKITKKVLNKLKNVRLIATRGTGFDHILAKKDNVIITPHNAFNSKEALQRILDTTVVNIKGFVNNKVVNKVNVGRGLKPYSTIQHKASS